MYKYIIFTFLLLFLTGCGKKEEIANTIPTEYITKETIQETEDENIQIITTEIIPIYQDNTEKTIISSENKKDEDKEVLAENPKENTNAHYNSIKAYNTQNKEVTLTPISPEQLTQIFPEIYSTKK